jgi:hypothetical protein
VKGSESERPSLRLRDAIWRSRRLVGRVVPISAVRFGDLIAVCAATCVAAWCVWALTALEFFFLAPIVVIVTVVGISSYLIDRRRALDAPPQADVVALNPVVETSVAGSERLVVIDLLTSAGLGAFGSSAVWLAVLGLALVNVACVAVHDPHPPSRTFWSMAASALDRVAALVSPAPEPATVAVSR